MSEHNSPLSVKPTFLQRVWRSIFPDPLIPRSDRERKRFLLKNLVLHFRPLTVPEKTLNFSLTWGLGGMAAVLILLQFGTGLLLKFAYEPNPITAYASIQNLQNAVMFGQLVRNLHHWGANLLVLIVFLHMLRVYFTGAFLPPRQYNWIIGLGLFGLVLFANLTGYLLPYDQLAFWAVTVSTGMLEYIPAIGIRLQEIIRGGSEIGPASLRIFYALHTAVVPVVLVFFMAFHFWRIRKAGGLVIPRKPDEAVAVAPTRVPTVPNLLLRETTVAVTLIAAVMLMAVFFDAPLEDPANPGLSPNPTKAPWYFAGLQEMLLHLHPTFSVFVIPLMMATGLLFLPYVHYQSDTRGIWFASPTGRRLAVWASVGAAIATPLLILMDDFVIGTGSLPFGLPPQISNGLIPVVLISLVAMAVYFSAKRRLAASNNEAIQTVVVLLLAAFIVLTVTSVWFRGQGMVLVWPF